MYTYEITADGYAILDPDGDRIAYIDDEIEVLSLLAHLNRG